MILRLLWKTERGLYAAGFRSHSNPTSRWVVRGVTSSSEPLGGSSIGDATRVKENSPLEEYDARVRLGILRDDPYQRKTIASLSTLHEGLLHYHPPVVEIPTATAPPSQSVFKSLWSKLVPATPPQTYTNSNPLGIYLYGDVGCGKTMLMDLFYDTIPSHLTKRRIHFHQFMQFLHRRSHQLKATTGADYDVLPILAAEIARDETVLCFDEFQVTDVADAMLLRRLLTTILTEKYGVILFATLNRPPDDLYINGIQRQSFIPCITLLKERAKVVYLNSPTDYRKVAKPLSSVYCYPKPGVPVTSKVYQAKAKEHVDEWFKRFSQGGKEVVGYKMQIWGRDLVVPKSVPPYVAQFTFKDLCGRPMAAGDYLTLATNFHSFVITDIPYLTIDARDQIRRFITFLDAVYDAGGRIATTGAAGFQDLFVEPEDLVMAKDPKPAGAVISNSNGSSLEPQGSESKASVAVGLAPKGPESKVLEMKASGSTTLDSETLASKPPSKQNLVFIQKAEELVEKHGFDRKVAQKASRLMNNIDEERFAFARALSRITQMSTREWVSRDKR